MQDGQRQEVLVLGGVHEGRRLAAALHARGIAVISSLAGRVQQPLLPPGEVRIGGFGGSEGLARWLRERRPVAIVDATHPFARQISAIATAAAERSSTPLLRIERPTWQQQEGDDWHWAADLDAAAALVPELGSRVFLTTGRGGLSAFAGVDSAWFLVRCLNEPDPPLPLRCEVLVDRGPYELEDELALLRERQIDLLVTKESGGTSTQPKLEAARALSLPVILVRRPAPPGTTRVEDVDAALEWVLEQLKEY